jgi:hypothetical protein
MDVLVPSGDTRINTYRNAYHKHDSADDNMIMMIYFVAIESEEIKDLERLIHSCNQRQSEAARARLMEQLERIKRRRHGQQPVDIESNDLDAIHEVDFIRMMMMIILMNSMILIICHPLDNMMCEDHSMKCTLLY